MFYFLQRAKFLIALLLTVSFPSLLSAQISNCNIQATDTAGCAPLIVVLNATATSGSPILNSGYVWTVKNVTTGNPLPTGVPSSTFSYLYSEPGYYDVSVVITNQAGQSCTVTKPKFIHIFGKPYANGYFTPASGSCVNNCISFHNTSTAGCGTLDPVVIDWKDGTITRTLSPVTCHIYTQANQYCPTVLVQNSCGCKDDTTFTSSCIVITTPPTAGFTNTDPTNCTSPYPVTFTADPTGIANPVYEWRLTDSLGPIISISSNFTYNFTSAGNYSVYLKVTNPISGCSTYVLKTNLIQIGALPAPKISSTTSKGCAPLSVNFSDITGSTTHSTSWIFAGGTPSTSNFTNPTVVYNTAGCYDVKMKVSYVGGCVDSVTLKNYACVGPIITPNFSTSDTLICNLPDTVTFTYTGTPCPSCTYTWSTSESPVAPNISAVKTKGIFVFKTYGLKTIYFTISDTFGCTKTLTKYNYVSAQKLTASIKKVKDSNCLPLNVTYTNTTVSGSPLKNPIVWSFQNGIPSSFIGSTPPPIAYSTPGCHKITLAIENQQGCRDTLRDSICVASLPTFNYTISPNVICFEQKDICFNFFGYPLSVDTVIVYPEFPSDTNKSIKDTTNKNTTTDLCYKYTNFGNFAPCVQVSASGCRSAKICATTAADSVTVNPPVASFQTITNCTNRYAVRYVNKSKRYNTFKWTFWDGNTSTTAMDTTIIYPNCGVIYPILLEAYNDTTGCYHKKADSTFTILCPVTDITTPDTFGCGPLSSIFNIKATGTIPNYVRWNFNAPAIGKVNFTPPDGVGTANVPFTFTTPGTYSIAAEIIYLATGGCRDTLRKVAYIKVSGTKASFNVSDTVGCIPFAVNFTNTSTVTLATIQNSLWNFSDVVNNTSINFNESHTFQNSGQYNVKLVVTNSAGCKDSIVRPIIANEIIANFSILDSNTCTTATDLVQCTNTSTGFNLKYKWLAPQGNPSTGNGKDFQCNFNGQLEGTYKITLIASDLYSTCADTITKDIVVKNPTANYSQDKFFGQCPPLPVQFIDSSKNDICKWDWNFGDGDVASYDKSNFKNPGHIYNVPGVFQSKLTVTSCHGCVDTFSLSNVVIKGPNATVSFAPFPGGCPCTDVVFKIATENGVSLYFLPGCGQPIKSFNPILPIGTASSPTYIYDTIRYCNVGVCVPQYIISDSLGCQVAFDKLTPPVVIDTPTVVIGMTKSVVCDSGIICFQDLTTYSVDSAKTVVRAWNFGDGTPTDTSKNPCHKYKTTGTFTVRLDITNNVNCTNFSTKGIYIPRSPVANFEVFDSTGCITTKVNYKDSSTSDPRTFINSWHYWFGEAGTQSFHPDTFHQFSLAGTYTSVLIVKDTFGCVDSFSKVIKSQNAPLANAGADKTICLGDSVLLNATGGVRYFWNPNYNISSQVISNPKVWPIIQTNYIVEVRDKSNCIAYDTVTIKISTIKASFYTDTVCLNQLTHFTDNSQSTGATLNSYSWNFGDATPLGNGSTTSHLYASDNTYNVKLVVKNTNQCKDSITLPVIVNPLPIANFKADTVCLGNNTTFTDLSSSTSGNIVKWDWEFGDVSVNSTSQNPTHNYAVANTYAVKLTTTNSFGCVHDTTISVVVRALPVANFTLDSVCFGLSNNFTSTSTNGSGTINSNFWDFDFPSPSVGTSSNFGSTTFQFGSVGSHAINLLVSDQFGCTDNVTKNTLVYSLPVADFTFLSTCIGSQTQFTDKSIAGANPINNWNWTFTTSPISEFTQNPLHLFNSLGKYPVHLEIIDLKGCKDSITKTVEIFDKPTAKITIDDSTVCLGVAINLTDASIAGVSAPITNTGWDLNSDGSVDNVTTAFSYTYSTPNLYKITLIVKDQNNCTDTAYQSVLVHRLPIANFTSQSSCINIPSSFTSTAILGDAPITNYDWIFPGLIGQTGSPTNFTFTQSGDFPITLSVTDANGCFDSIVKTITVNSTDLNLTPRDTTICLGSSVGILAQGQFDKIAWTPSTWVDNPNNASVVITPLSSIRYIVRAQSGDCPALVDTANITVIRAPEITVTATPQEIILGLSSNITSEVLGKSDSIVWSPDTALSCRKCLNPIASPKQTTTYTATVYYGKNGIICSNSASVTITVIQSCNGETLYIPNTFSPNADGNNDRFIIRGMGITKINHFRVYDRWGKIVFDANDVNPKSDDASWNGGLKNDLGKAENPGVFVYEFEVECITGDKISGKGNITLIR